MAHSQYLKVLNFNHNIASTSIVKNVRARIKRYASSRTGIVDASVRLISQGNIVGAELRHTGTWDTIEGWDYYETGPSLAGLALTPTLVNRTDFGIAIAVICRDISAPDAYINNIQMEVVSQSLSAHTRNTFGQGYVRKSFFVRFDGSDCQAIDNALNDVDLSTADYTLAQKIWTGGFQNWPTTTPITFEDDPDVREVTIDHPDVSIDNMAALLIHIAETQPEQHEYMHAIASAILNGSAIING